MLNHITQAFKHMTNAYTENAFHAQALLPASTTKCTPASTPTPLPSGDTCPYHARFLGLCIRSLSTLSSRWLHSCADLARPHLCRFTQEPINPPVWSPDNMHTQCRYLGVYPANTATVSEMFPPVVMLHRFFLWETEVFFMSCMYCAKGGDENEAVR